MNRNVTTNPRTRRRHAARRGYPPKRPNASTLARQLAVAVFCAGAFGAFCTAAWAQSVPGPPKNLRVSGDAGSVTLTWEAPDSDGGSSIWRYDYQRYSGSGWRDSPKGTTRQLTVNKLGSGEYQFRVRAVNSHGPGPPSATVHKTLNHPPTGKPRINGTPTVPNVLTADISGIEDKDGVPAKNWADLPPSEQPYYNWWRYQWLRSGETAQGCSRTVGQSENTYRLTAADTTRQIRVFVCYQDNYGTWESVVSDFVPISGTVGADTTPPVLRTDSRTHVDENGWKIHLQFSEILNPGAGPREAVDETLPPLDCNPSYFPPPSAFSVNLNDKRDVDVARVAVEGCWQSDGRRRFRGPLAGKVELQMNAYKSIKEGQTITVTYTDPTSGDDGAALQDRTGNDVASFEVEVDNRSTLPLTDKDVSDTPRASGANVARSGRELTVFFDEALANNSPPVSAFEVTAAGSPVAIGAVEILTGDDAHKLRLSGFIPTVKQGQRVSVVYTPPASGDVIEDVDGNPADSFSKRAQNDSTRLPGPELGDGQVAGDGLSIYIQFYTELRENSPPVGAFELKVGGAPVSIGAIDIFGDDFSVDLRDFSRTIGNGEDVKLSYTEPTHGDVLEGTDGNPVDSFADFQLDNQSYVHTGTGPGLSIADAMAREGVDETMDFVVTLSPPATTTVSVSYGTAVGPSNTATPNVDYTHTTGRLEFAPGETSMTVSVPIIDDTVDDDGETFRLDLNAPMGAGIIGSPFATGTIHNDDPVADRSELSVADAEATEGEDDALDFVVTLDPAAADTVTVDYATADGTAVEGDDYRTASGTLTFDPGDTSKTVSVRIINDGDPDHGETMTLTLSNASGADLADAEATGTILNTESDPLTATFNDVPEQHGGENTTFTFEVEFSEAIRISYTTLRDESFTVTNGDVTGASRVDGDHDKWQITVEPASDETVTIELPGGRACGTAGAICTRGDEPRPLSNSESDTVAGPGGASVATNTPATGAPTISGTPQVGQELTASTSDISDADGRDDASFSYQWLRGDADIAGANGSTYTPAGADRGSRLKVRVGFTSDADGRDDASFSYQWLRGDADIDGANGSTYTPAAEDEGSSLKVRVGFTDDAGNDESLTSAATDAVAAAKPLTASFSSVPKEHRGAGTTFTFGLTFSEDVKLSYATLRDDAFVIGGGSVETAKRQQSGSNQGWDITVAPSGAGEVTIDLPETSSCSAAGAICTRDTRPLSHALSDTVAAPVGISVADARVEEAEDAVLEFVVTLSRAASAAFTVAYQTADGSAQAGADYTAENDTVSFEAGDTSKTIEVEVLDDAHDEVEETLTLTLSNASKGVLTDAEATGTIENHDPLPRALLARFGRTAAVHVVEHVEERLQAPREPGFRGRFAGRELRRGMERDVALGFLSRLGGGGVHAPAGGMHAPPAGAPRAGAATLGTPGLSRGHSGMGAASGPLGAAAGPAGSMAGAAGLGGGPLGGGLLSMGLGGGGLLTGSAFSLNRETRHGGILSFWSRGAQSSFRGREGALGLGGDVRTTMFGADYAQGPLVAGLSLAHSRGLGSYDGLAVGEVASAVTGLYPWLGYQVTDRVSVWGVTGYGAGGLLLTPDAGSALESALSMKMAAAGTRGELVAGGASGFELAFKADALWVGTAIDGVDGPAGRLAATEAAVSRLRTALESSRGYTLGGRLSLTPSVEVGLRHDAGDAETGAGLDIGSGLVVSDAGTGLAVDFRVRMLVAHQAEGFRERGMALTLSYNATPSTPFGFNARVAPSWGGQAMSGAEALWGRESMAGMAHGGFAQGDRLDGEVGYGLPVGNRFVGTPRVGFSTSEYGKDYRFGYGLGVLDRDNLDLELGVDAHRRESPMLGGTDKGFLGQATLGW